MNEAIKRIDNIIERRGECIIGGIMEMFLGYDKETLANELRARGYVVRDAASVDGYVVYPKRKKTSPHFIVQIV